MAGTGGQGPAVEGTEARAADRAAQPAQDWRVSRSGDACVLCREGLAEGAVFYSALAETPDGFQRRDLCSCCWEGADRDGLFCFWRTRKARVERKPVLDTELMIEFFERLQGAETDERQAFRFVLALYLMRRKELKLLEVSRSEEGEVMVFERRGTGARVEVANPRLDEAQTQAAAAQLGSLFQAEL